MLRDWSRIAPAAASAWVEQLPVGQERQQSQDTVAVAWASQDLDAAVQWARQLPDEQESARLIALMVGEAGRSDPIQGLNLACELAPGVARDDLVLHSASQWAVDRPQEAIEWARGIDDPQLRQRVLSAAAISWAETDPEAAAKFAIQSIPASKPQEDAIVGIIQRWTQTQPEAVAAWVTEFPEGALKETAFEEMVKLWTDKTPDAAGDWLSSLSPGTFRDAGIAAYATKIAPESPEIAAQWARTITNVTRRDQELAAIQEASMIAGASGAPASISGQTP
jgi:hypothetical protein